MIIEERAYARAGLLGNPSDGYYGKTISVSVKNFAAHVSIYETPELIIEPQPEDINEFPDILSLVDRIKLHGYYGGDRLIKAAIKKFYEYCQQNSIKLSNKNFTIRYHSTIPRQVGLAGSSAIITATIRGLMRFYQVEIKKVFLPTLILSVEQDELGINAGLQDRVIQVYEGCVSMDFDKKYLEKNGHGIYEELKPKGFENLYIAYKTELGKVSGTVLNDIKRRYDEGDQDVIEILSHIASLAEQGKQYIENGDSQKLDALINENFDLRCKIMNISESNMQMVQFARDCGASAKFAGSGGAVIGLFENDEMLKQLITNMKKINARVIKPYIF